MIATQYSTASEATGCRHSTTVLRVLGIIECRHPVASLAVLYWRHQSHNSCSIAKFLPTRYPLLGSDVESLHLFLLFH